MATRNQSHTRASEKRGQSAIDYLTTYGWAVLIITLIVSIFYFYISAPTQAVSNTCNFVSGVYCSDIVLGTNLTTHATVLALFLINSQQEPISNPMISAQVNLLNSQKFGCAPDYVLPGGSILCIANLPINTTTGSLVSGRMYLSGTYCSLSGGSYSSGGCPGATNQTYVGIFALHTQPLISEKTTLNLTATNFTEAANNSLDRLTATVNLLGYPLRGATIRFAENNTAYLLQPNFTLSDIYGNTLNYISGGIPGKVIVTASYAGLSKSILITFVNPIAYYPLTLNMIPTNSEYSWKACLYYTQPSNSPEELCAGNGPSTVSINVLYGTIIDSITTANLTGFGLPYAFENWSGSYSSNQAYSNIGTVLRDPYTVDANYRQTILTLPKSYYYINSSSQGDPCDSNFPGDTGPCALQGGTPVITTGSCGPVAQGYYQNNPSYDDGWTLYACTPGTSGYVPSSDGPYCETIDAYMNLGNGGSLQSSQFPVTSGTCTYQGNGYYMCEMPFTNMQANISAYDYYSKTYCPS